ncbi:MULTISPECIES: M56 family metallopeptidase [unclassified Myroides]|uniref:M56 family metallopeptidase n=1 Tax=unclassified Myroides TaxID=2642485 RepID=UPI003D2F6D0A
MHSFVEYLLKVNGLLVVVLAFYYLVLRKETFFSAIRYYFLVGIGLSFILPLLRFTQTVYVKQHIDWSALLQQGNEDVLVEEQLSWLAALNWQTILAYLVLTISSVLGLIFVSKVMRLTRYVMQLPRWTDHAKIKIDGTTQEAYSFWNWIVLPKQYGESETLATIIQHEQVHVEEKHSIDLLLISGIRRIFWFNPLLILLEQVIRLNLEYSVDQKVSAVQNSYEYQMTLVRFEQTKGSAMPLVNSFGSSDLKKRIIKLNQPKSKNMKKSKFVLCLPLVVGFFLLFQVKTKAEVVFVDQEQMGSNTEQEPEKTKHTGEVTEESGESLPLEQQETAAVKKKEEDKSQVEKSAEKKAGSVQIIKRDADGNVVYQTDDATDEELVKYNIVRMDNGKGSLKQFKIVTSENGTTKGRIYINGKDYSLEELAKLGLEVSEDEISYSYTIDKETLLGDAQRMKEIVDNKKEQSRKEKEDARKKMEESRKQMEASRKEVEASRQEMEKSRKYMEASRKEMERSRKKLEKSRMQQLEGIKDKLIIYNGKEMSLEELEKISPNGLGGGTIKIYSTEESIEKYGEKGKKGVIVVTSGSNSGNKATKQSFSITSMQEGEGEFLYVIDGKRIKPSEVSAIKSEDIDHVNVLKGEMATEKYGKEAEKGVIEIFKKK